MFKIFMENSGATVLVFMVIGLSVVTVASLIVNAIRKSDELSHREKLQAMAASAKQIEHKPERRNPHDG